MTTPTHFIVSTFDAKKLSASASGAISFAVVVTADLAHVGLAITGNEGGGYFSKEVVMLTALEACVHGIPPDQPLRSGAFRQAFLGRSANNSGFACACLVHLGLLCQTDGPMPGRGRCFAIGAAWDAWRDQVLADAKARGDSLTPFAYQSSDDSPAEAQEMAEAPTPSKPKRQATKRSSPQGSA